MLKVHFNVHESIDIWITYGILITFKFSCKLPSHGVLTDLLTQHDIK